MSKDGKHYCDKCGDRIFRKGYNIDAQLLCKHCVNDVYMIRFKDDYILKDKPAKEDK